MLWKKVPVIKRGAQVICKGAIRLSSTLSELSFLQDLLGFCYRRCLVIWNQLGNILGGVSALFNPHYHTGRIWEPAKTQSWPNKSQEMSVVLMLLVVMELRVLRHLIPILLLYNTCLELMMREKTDVQVLRKRSVGCGLLMPHLMSTVLYVLDKFVPYFTT